MILFLDFDGVLHPEPVMPGCELAELPQLESLLREFPAVRLVISSTWRAKRGLDDLRRLFSADIARRIVGVTPILRGYENWPYTRQSEITEWLTANDLAHSAWVALDDKPHLFRPFCRNLIVCSSQTGIDAEALQALRIALGKGAS